ncbi:MAG: hypothetical protein WAU15_10930 [Nitrosomonas sp.]
MAVTVQNVGEYPSRFRSFCLWARDPAGRNIDSVIGGIEAGLTSLNPGQSKAIARNIASFGAGPGPYTLGVSKESLKGHWQNIPPVHNGASSTRQLRLWPKAKTPRRVGKRT